MRFIKRYVIEKDDGKGNAIYFEKFEYQTISYSISEMRERTKSFPVFGGLDEAKLFNNEKDADNFIKANEMKDSYPVEIQEGV